MLAIPAKRGDHTVITYLTDIEAQALLHAPDRTTRTGRRDHALLTLAVQTGLRASELISLTRNDIHLDTGAHVLCLGLSRARDKPCYAERSLMPSSDSANSRCPVK